jgi:diaminopimelate epimerase
MAPEHAVRFVKAEANGNDFLIIDAAAVAPAARAEFTRRVCDRHRGVGADGVEFVRPRGAGFELTLFNSDGTEAEISGNGTRCVAAFYARHGFRQGEMATRAGLRAARVLDGGGQMWTVEVDMGAPAIEGRERLAAAGREWEVTVLSMGNPQCVLLVEAFPGDWEALGMAIANHARFPQRTNVAFVRTLDRHHLDARIVERGVGPTRSSGTGSCAAAVAAMAQGLAVSPVEVATPGGRQKVTWTGGGAAGGGVVKLTGPAWIVAEGMVFPRGL